MSNTAHSHTMKMPPLPHRVPRAKEIDLHSSKSNASAVIGEVISLRMFSVGFGGVYKSVQRLLQNKELIRDIRVEMLVCENNLNLIKESLKLESTPSKHPDSSPKGGQVDFEVNVLQFVEKQKALRRDEIEKDEAYANMPEMRLVPQEVQQAWKDSSMYRPPYSPGPSAPVGYPTPPLSQPYRPTENPYRPGSQPAPGVLYHPSPQTQFNPNVGNAAMGPGQAAWLPNVPTGAPYAILTGSPPPLVGYPPGGALPPFTGHPQSRPSPPFRQHYGHYTPC
ncbi:unnamed protein product [Phytomonas sp. EM1]|nr:unnamed protein product [Phytomonas sp. EM1]|eukprot:CCW60949.1 unnamed protein product [Phytomonas sp. isolate EM1]